MSDGIGERAKCPEEIWGYEGLERFPSTLIPGVPQSRDVPGIAGPERIEMKTEQTNKPAPTLPEKPLHTLALEPTETKGVFFAKVTAGRVVVAFAERNRSKADFKLYSVTFPEARMKAAKATAKETGLPLFMGLCVRVAGKWSSGWLVSFAAFSKNKQGEADFSLTESAREAYAADKDSLLAVRFEIAKAEKKGAA